MLLRLTKIQSKMIGIYAQVVLHDLGCRPGGGSQRNRASSASAGNGEVNPNSECIPSGQNTTKIIM
jgi:hypothetical protein